jgi:HD-GYP domain-containing protein (c-di-GMP phosphodiesterase class II)
VQSTHTQKPGSDYVHFSVERLVDNSATDFDIFLSLERHFILYSGNGYKWHRSELTELLHAGHEHFFIRSTDAPKAQMYQLVAKLPEVDKELAPPARIRTIEQVGAKFVQCLYQGELTEACVEKGRDVAASLTECVAEDKSCVKFLSVLSDHDYYTYFHSVRVAAYAVAIAVGMGLKDRAMLRQVAFGGLFHDVGKMDVPLTVLNKSGPLTDAEWGLIRSHPEAGHTKVGESVLSHVPREIILHHHEKRNGAGYPHGLDKGSLLPEVQIATLADIFDALTSSRSYQNKRTRFEALDFIKHRLLREEVCQDAFRALVLCLAS